VEGMVAVNDDHMDEGWVQFPLAPNKEAEEGLERRRITSPSTFIVVQTD
jgi:hypothetical protein